MNKLIYKEVNVLNKKYFYFILLFKYVKILWDLKFIIFSMLARINHYKNV